MDLDHAVVIIGHNARMLSAVLHINAVVGVTQLRIGLLEGNLTLLRVLEIRNISIHALILNSALLPGQILLHAASAHGVEGLPITEVNLDRIHDHQVQRLGRVIHEGKTCAQAVKFLIGAHRVAQAAGRVNDRNGAVAHGHHLGKTAGLEAGRHQIHICAGENCAGRLFIIVAGEADHARPFGFGPVEVIHVLLIALSEYDQLDAQIHQTRENLLHQLDALLLIQAGDKAEQRPLRGLNQAELFLNFPLALRLAGHIVRCEVGRDHRIRRGVVVFLVNTIQDAVKSGVNGIDDILQTVRILREVKFSCIVGRDRRYGICHQHGALHQVDIVTVLILIAQAASVPAAVQSEHILQQRGGVLALIGDIVNGVDGFDRFQLRTVDLLALQIHDHQRGLPVIAVNDVRTETVLRQKVDDRV